MLSCCTNQIAQKSDLNLQIVTESQLADLWVQSLHCCTTDNVSQLYGSAKFVSIPCTNHNSTAPFNATACVLPGTIRRDPSGVKVMRRKKEERASSIHIRNCFVPPLCEETNRHKLQQLPLQPCSQALGSFLHLTQEPWNVATASKELYV